MLNDKFVENSLNERITGYVDKSNFEKFLAQTGWDKLPIKISSSINTQLFIEQNLLNPQAWQAAFEFLKKGNFDKMQLGKYDLPSAGTYAIISEYTTKEANSSYFEAHRKYIDIQYLVSGKEYVVLTSLDDKQEIIHPYDHENDYELFQKSDEKFLLADKNTLFVFFHSDGHKPGIKVNESELVRKIVVKIPYKERS